MELVLARQDSDALSVLKVTHADDTRCLARLCVRVEVVEGQLIQLRLAQAFRLEVIQLCRKANESLKIVVKYKL